MTEIHCDICGNVVSARGGFDVTEDFAFQGKYDLEIHCEVTYPASSGKEDICPKCAADAIRALLGRIGAE